MKQCNYVKRTMETGDHLKNGASLKNLMSRVNELKRTGFLLLMFFFLFTGCVQPPDPVDISSINMEEYVTLAVKNQLDRAVKANIIIQYTLEPIGTPTESFRKIAQNHLADGATLHPNLTYRITYLGGVVVDSEKHCEAMAYSIVKDGKLYGTGVVFSEVLRRAWAQIWTIGDNSTDTGVNWSVWIGFILLLIMSPLIFRLVAHLRQY